MNIEILVICFIAAALSGIIAGLFGGGIGLILVPVLLWVFKLQGVPDAILMHLAVGTCVAVISILGLVATISHHRAGSFNKIVFLKMAVGTIIGCIIGSILASILHTDILILIFGAMVLILAFYVLFSKEHHCNPNRTTPTWIYNFCGATFGIFAGLTGASTFVVPFLKRLGFDIRTAIGTSMANGTLMAVVITVTFIITGWHESNLPKYSTGYVDWLVFLPIVIASSVFTPLGTKLAHRIPRNILKNIYSIFLFIIAVKMLYTGIMFYVH